nr:uncharacterized protein LOC129256031 [Lytechinus pictus]
MFGNFGGSTLCAGKEVSLYTNLLICFTSITNVQRIPMSGIQTKKFRYMTKCSVFGYAMCSRYRLVYVNAFRELVTTQYAVRPGCCKGYVQDGTMCLEAPPTTMPPQTSTRSPTTVRTQTVRAPFGDVSPRGSSGGYPIKEGSGVSKGQSGHRDEVLIDQEGGYFEVNPDYKGPAVDRVLPLIASGVAGVITLTAVVAFVLIFISRRKRKRNKVQPGFHDSVRFRTNHQPKDTNKLEMKRMSTEKSSAHALALAVTNPNPKASKKFKRLSRKDGPYVEISDIPGTPFARVTSKTEETIRSDLQNDQVHAAFINNRRSLNESQRKQRSPVKRGGSMKIVPQYAVVNKLRKPDTDCEELLDAKNSPKNNNDAEDNLHGAYHAFTLEHQVTGDSAPLYADPNQKQQNKSRTWACRVGSSLKENRVKGVGTLTPGNVLALVKQSNLRETSKLFTSCGDGVGNRRLSSGYTNKDDDSENSSGYSSLRHSIEGEPDMYGKLNHATSVKPSSPPDTKGQTAALEAADVNDYDKLRRGPKSRTLGLKWATSGHYETLDVDET